MNVWLPPQHRSFHRAPLGKDLLCTLMKGKGLSEIMALLLDGRLQGLLANPKVSECMKSKSPLLLPRIATRCNQTFWKHQTAISPEKLELGLTNNKLNATMVSVWCCWILTCNLLNKMQHQYLYSQMFPQTTVCWDDLRSPLLSGPAPLSHACSH